MAQEATNWRRPKPWIILVGVIILLIFLYFYPPFETYLLANIPNIRFNNVVFWFASLVGVIAYAVAHWQALKQHIVRSSTELQVESLVFDALQTAIMTAMIFTAGATLQAIVTLSGYLIKSGPIFDRAGGEKLLSIVLLLILSVLFYLLHHLARALRSGWQPRRPPRQVSASRE